jgi:hypothetical protein
MILPRFSERLSFIVFDVPEIVEKMLAQFHAWFELSTFFEGYSFG